MDETDLGAKMIRRADMENLPPDHPLRIRAAEFTEVAIGFASNPQTKTVQQMMGAWARARRVWCEHTGDNLI